MGAINMTYDAQQAENVEAYFAVTGYWIEELSVGVLEVQSAMIEFTPLNNAHNGVQLGQALFKVVDQVGIAHKVYYFEAKQFVFTFFNRLAMSHVTIPQTTTQCLTSFPFDLRFAIARFLYQRNTASGLIFTVFLIQIFTL